MCTLSDAEHRQILKFAIEAANRWKDKKVYFIPHKTYKEDFFTVRGETSKEPALPANAQILS